MPGTAKPEPKAAPSVWVTETTIPSPSAQAKWVVCSLTNVGGWPSPIWSGSRSAEWRSPSLRPARRGSMRARCAAAYCRESSPASGGSGLKP